MVAQEVRPKWAKRSQKVTQLAVENVLSNLFITETVEIYKGVKHTPYQYTETLLTFIAEKGRLDAVFIRSMKCCTQSTSFVNALTQRALKSPRFVRPVTNNVKSHMENYDEEWRIST